MPRKPRKLPQPNHHKHSGQARVKLDGRYHYLGPWQSDEAERRYKQLLAEWAASGGHLPSRGPGVTIAEVCDAYLTHAKSYYRSADGKTSGQLPHVKVALRDLLEVEDLNTLAQDFGPLRLLAVQAHMVAKGYARKHINQRIAIIREAFRFCASRQMIDSKLWQDLKTVENLKMHRTTARESVKVRPVTWEQIAGILPHVSPVVGGLIQLQWFTGMRPGEACILRGVDIDQAGPEGCWVYRPAHHKMAYTGRDKVILIGPKAQQLLRPFLDTKQPTEYLFSPRDSHAWHMARKREQRQTPVQPSQRDRSRRGGEQRRRDHFTTSGYRQAISYGCERAEIPAWNPNQLRHARATALRREYGLETARAVLGHTSASVTETYAELDLGLAAKAMHQSG